jgi:hypothetical protein
MKTLVGKHGYLFLQNDESKELDIHCNNVSRVFDPSLSRYTFSNYHLFVYPDKSILYRHFLPDTYQAIYRPALDIYQRHFKDRCIDLYELLSHEDTYYKTDTHINGKGSYLVYQCFIRYLRSLHLEPPEKKLELEPCECILQTLPYGVGDLTWPSNLGNVTLDDPQDVFYRNESMLFVHHYKICSCASVRFLNNTLQDVTATLEGQLVTWDIISNYIIHIQNPGPRILIFYDSFLLQSLALYFDFFDIYFVKDVYSNDIIKTIQPEYVFEFRIERFLF